MKPTHFAASVVSIALTLGMGAVVAQGEFASTQSQAYGYAHVEGYVQDRDDHRDQRDHDDGGWDAAPRGYSDVQLRGYRDGIDGAQKDYGNHRRPNPNNRENYRHPHDVPHDLDRDYRTAFRQGYRRAFAHMEGRDVPRQD